MKVATTGPAGFRAALGALSGPDTFDPVGSQISKFASHARLAIGKTNAAEFGVLIHTNIRSGTTRREP